MSNKKARDFGIGHYYTCPVCHNKKFIPYICEYVYKINSKTFCSWTCFRKYKAEHPRLRIKH